MNAADVITTITAGNLGKARNMLLTALRQGRVTFRPARVNNLGHDELRIDGIRIPSHSLLLSQVPSNVAVLIRSTYQK